MAIEQYSGLLARIFVGFPIHFRHPRVPQNQQYGCFAFRYSAGIQSTLDTNGCLFSGYLPGFQAATEIGKTQG